MATQDIVTQFIGYDFNGYRLGSKGHQAIWDLTDRDGEPPAAPVVVARDFKILSAKQSKSGICQIRVGFNTYGFVTEELTFNNRPSVEEWPVNVQCTERKCQIRINLDEFKLSPHPGKNAVLKWLDDLLLMSGPSFADPVELARKDRAIHKLKAEVISLK